MSGDAIAVFHPKDLSQLEPFLDLDGESEESDGLYAEALDDGTILVHTFQPFEIFEQNPAEARAWLSQFGDALPDVHDDPRGLLFFPDTFEPDATTYDAVIAEMADKGIFIATTLVDDGAIAGGGAFETAQLFEQMQQQLAEALGMQLFEAPEESPIIEDEFAPDEPEPDKK